VLIDARTVPSGRTIETEVCIVGAGAAGITLAREFIDRPFRVCLLESGGLEFDEATQSLYDGEIAGLPYTPLKAARARYFGGTTNHWNGWCRPLDELDFQTREWIPHSGWPFGRADLEPYYKRAQAICQLGPFHYDPEAWQTQDAPSLPLAGGRVITSIFQFSPPTRFGQLYREEIRRARNLTTYLGANVLEIEPDKSGRTVSRLRVASLQGNKFWISAKFFILATGGIENARLLLVSNKVYAAGLGNQNGLVGRFFMDHVNLESGAILLSNSDISTALYSTRGSKELAGLVEKIDGGSMEKFLTPRDKETIMAWVRDGAKKSTYRESIEPILRDNCASCHSPDGIAFFRPLTSYARVMAVARVDRSPVDTRHARGGLTLAPEIQRRERLQNCCAILYNRHWTRALKGDSFWESLGNVVSNIDAVAAAVSRNLFKQNGQPQLFHILNMVEPTPNPDSRVTLANKRDSFGQNCARLDWRLNSADKHVIGRTQEMIALELGRTGLGRLMRVFDNDDTSWPSALRHGWHHMGTTRMHVDPKKGVVDENCGVHGISNLFIAGSSVFPTYGYAQPTLTILALSVRLADYIKRVIA
jgi:choline dehydrogenase-like flavoprotein